MKVAIVGSKTYHIKSAIIVIATSGNRVAIIRAKSNLSTYNCIVVNEDIRRVTIDFVYNKKLDNVSI
jgi:hypothetical protein